MNKMCSVIRDLLPLYIEDMVSEDTRAVIDEHLADCPACRAELASLETSPELKPETSAAPLKRLRRDLRKKKIQTIAVTVAFMAAILLSLFAYVTAPQYFSYTPGLMTLTEDENGAIIIVFNEKVTGSYCYDSGDTNEPGTNEHYVEAWTTLWDTWVSKPGVKSLVIAPEPELVQRIWYSSNDGTFNVVLHYIRRLNAAAETFPGILYEGDVYCAYNSRCGACGVI